EGSPPGSGRALRKAPPRRQGGPPWANGSRVWVECSWGCGRAWRPRGENCGRGGVVRVIRHGPSWAAGAFPSIDRTSAVYLSLSRMANTSAARWDTGPNPSLPCISATRGVNSPAGSSAQAAWNPVSAVKLVVDVVRAGSGLGLWLDEQRPRPLTARSGLLPLVELLRSAPALHPHLLPHPGVLLQFGRVVRGVVEPIDVRAGQLGEVLEPVPRRVGRPGPAVVIVHPGIEAPGGGLLVGVVDERIVQAERLVVDDVGVLVQEGVLKPAGLADLVGGLQRQDAHAPGLPRIDPFDQKRVTGPPVVHGERP